MDMIVIPPSGDARATALSIATALLTSGGEHFKTLQAQIEMRCKNADSSINHLRYSQEFAKTIASVADLMTPASSSPPETK